MRLLRLKGLMIGINNRLSLKPSTENPIFSAAALDLQFAAKKTLDPRVTFTRASTGTYVGSSGVLRSAVTNLLLRSEEFETSPWSVTSNNASVSANQEIAPNGTLTADKLVEDTTASTFHRVQQSATLAAGSVTYSVYLKAAGRNFALLVVFNGTNSRHIDVKFNLLNGTVDTVVNGSASITNVGNGWFRCSVSSTTTVSANNTAYVYAASVAGGGATYEAYTGDGTSGIYLWGAQLEQSSTVGDYVPTTSTINSAPRFDHNPTTGESLGLLVEEARTNLMLYSEQLNDSVWGPVVGTVTPNAETSPANTLTTDKLIAANGGPQGQLAQGATITSGATVTASVYAKAGGFDRLELVLLAANNTTPYGRSTFNPNTGVITTAAFTSNGGTNASSAVQALSNGWYRFSVTVTYPAVTSAGMRLVVTNSDAANGDGVKGVFLWGAQLEAGALPTSYIPTTSATVTRAADVASITGSNFSSWYNQMEGTVFADANVGSGNFPYIYGISDGTSNNRILLYRLSATATSSTNFELRVDSGGSNSAALSVNAATTRFGFAYKTNDFAVSGNGGAAITDATGAVPSVNQMTVGGPAFFQCNGTIKRLTYWPTRLANTTLQQLTR